ncbi:MAG: ABC transporter ATP-binding protein, partial [Erysipelotrichales bacterium]|nr:ABC transporter ATP-binding protein [Erysipelotrichales bacterium]
TLAPEPSVLFMDEPLSNLDAKLRLEMRSELQRLHLETGSTFVYVTHDQMEAMTLATRICLIDNGVLQQYDAPLTVYNTPNNLFVADFVGNPSINFIDAKGTQNADGTISLKIFDDRNVVFTPNDKLDLKKWYADEKAADDKAKAEKAEKAAKKGHVEKGNKDTVFKYHVAMIDEREDYGDEVELTEEDFVLGIRPEFIDIGEDKGMPGEIYSSMPTGMETTVRAAVGNYILTGVMFGGVVYKLGDKTNVSFKGNNVILFSRRSGRFITLGKLDIQ